MSKEKFENLAEKYMDTIYRVAYSWTKNSDDANDVTQDDTNGGITKKLLTEARISANIFYRKGCYREATVRLSYLVIKKAT